MIAYLITLLSRRHFAAAVLFVASAASAEAAPIIWASPAGISGDGDVSTNGTLVDAFNIAGQNTTVNGVLFREFATGAVVNTVGNYTLEIDPNNRFDVLDARGTGSANAPFSSLSASYQALLGTAGADGENIDLTIAGLTAGLNYEFQLWVNNSQDTTGFNVSVEATNAASLNPNPSLNSGGLGQSIIGSFTADSASQFIEIIGSEVVVANAFQLRTTSRTSPVPVPATLPMFALGMIGLAFARRRLR